MAETIYLLCSFASIACAVLLFSAYRKSGARLLLWSCSCFLGLALNNVLLFVDLILVPTVDLRPWRAFVALVGISVLLFGLVWSYGERPV